MSNNKTIAKNTIFLYIRMLLSMMVSLYTSRVVLNALGASDFGLYNVVGGVISILSVLNVLVASGTQRFLNYEMGKKAPIHKLTDIFTSSLTIYLAIYGFIFIIAETVGLWFVNYKLIVPENRIFAVNVVYQITIIQLLLTFIQSTYTSVILAHERMDIYGYIGVSEPILRLILISMLPFCILDKLVVYSFIIFVMGLCSTSFYIWFCHKRFKECRFRISRNMEQIKGMLSFTAWNLMEALSNALNGQGLNILLNIFSGPIVNASRAVAFQVNTAVHGFATNFLIAMYPQITKNYSSGNLKEFFNMMIRGGKFAFIVLSIIMFPIMLNTEYILKLWLKTPPENSALFVKLILIAELIRIISEPIYTGIQATGKIKMYQIVTNVFTLSNIPLCYFLLKIWHEPVIVFYSTIAVSTFFVISRVFFINLITDFPLKKYICVIILRCLVPFFIIYLPLHYINQQFEVSLSYFIIISILTIVFSGIVFGIISLTSNEKRFILGLLNHKK